MRYVAGWAWSVLQVPLLAPLLAVGAQARLALFLSAMGTMVELAVRGDGLHIGMDMMLASLTYFFLSCDSSLRLLPEQVCIVRCSCIFQQPAST